MKVGLELQPCCGKRSGIGTYTYELAKRLQNQDGLEFYGNLFNFFGRNDNSKSLEGILMPIVENRLLPYGVYRRVWDRLPISYQKMFPYVADLNLFFNYIVPPGVNGKVMTTIYDMTYLRFPETMDSRNLKRIQGGIQYSVERSSHLLTISEFSKREITELLNISEDRISVVYSAPSFSDEIDDFQRVQEKFGIEQPYLLYVGTVEPRKNLVRLIRAFEKLKKEANIMHQLVLAGGNGWQNGEIYQAAEESFCKEKIIFTGYLSNGEKNTLYKNASAFVFPSLYEGFGMPPLEAMHWGCPVVTADAASLPEVVGVAAELVDPLNEEMIAEGIWRVLSNDDYAKELVREGYSQSKRFSWDASAQQLIAVCKEVLERK